MIEANKYFSYTHFIFFVTFSNYQLNNLDQKLQPDARRPVQHAAARKVLTTNFDLSPYTDARPDKQVKNITPTLAGGMKIT